MRNKSFILLKYSYGIVKTYTCYCLIPSTRELKKLLKLGNFKKLLQLAYQSDEARYFQSAQSAKQWLAENSFEVLNPDWNLSDSPKAPHFEGGFSEFPKTPSVTPIELRA